jgi:hypothetical protein
LLHPFPDDKIIFYFLRSDGKHGLACQAINRPLQGDEPSRGLAQIQMTFICISSGPISGGFVCVSGKAVARNRA